MDDEKAAPMPKTSPAPKPEPEPAPVEAVAEAPVVNTPEVPIQDATIEVPAPSPEVVLPTETPQATVEVAKTTEHPQAVENITFNPETLPRAEKGFFNPETLPPLPPEAIKKPETPEEVKARIQNSKTFEVDGETFKNIDLRKQYNNLEEKQAAAIGQLDVNGSMDDYLDKSKEIDRLAGLKRGAINLTHQIALEDNAKLGAAVENQKLYETLDALNGSSPTITPEVPQGGAVSPEAPKLTKKRVGEIRQFLGKFKDSRNAMLEKKKAAESIGTVEGVLKKDEKAKLQEEAEQAEMEYKKMRAEYVGEKAHRFIGEKARLAEQQAEQFQQEKGFGKKVYDAYKKTGEWNLGKVLGEGVMKKLEANENDDTDTRVRKSVARFATKVISVRTAVSGAMLGAGLAFGAGAAAGIAAIGARRVLSGIGAGFGSYDLMKMKDDLNKKGQDLRIGKYKISADKDRAKMQELKKEDLAGLSNEEILTRMDHFDVAGQLNGVNPKDNETYKLLGLEFNARARAGKTEEPISEVVAQEGVRAAEIKKDEQGREVKRKVVAGAIGAVVGSGVLAKAIGRGVAEAKEYVAGGGGKVEAVMSGGGGKAEAVMAAKKPMGAGVNEFLEEMDKKMETGTMTPLDEHKYNLLNELSQKAGRPVDMDEVNSIFEQQKAGKLSQEAMADIIEKMKNGGSPGAPRQGVVEAVRAATPEEEAAFNTPKTGAAEEAVREQRFETPKRPYKIEDLEAAVDEYNKSGTGRQRLTTDEIVEQYGKPSPELDKVRDLEAAVDEYNQAPKGRVSFHAPGEADKIIDQHGKQSPELDSVRAAEKVVDGKDDKWTMSEEYTVKKKPLSADYSTKTIKSEGVDAVVGEEKISGGTKRSFEGNFSGEIVQRAQSKSLELSHQMLDGKVDTADKFLTEIKGIKGAELTDLEKRSFGKVFELSKGTKNRSFLRAQLEPRILQLLAESGKK
jgi:hypothetical protein